MFSRLGAADQLPKDRGLTPLRNDLQPDVMNPATTAHSHGAIRFSVPDALRPVWVSLCEDTGGCVHVVDVDGTILFANEPAKAIAAPGRGPAGAGRRLSELWDDDFARERQDMVRQVAKSGHALAIEGLMHGRLVRSTFRAMEGDNGERVVLIVTAPARMVPQAPGATEVVRAKVNDAGPLSSLTSREMEILRLIGEGLSTSDIAESLHRSVKTVEWHRVSLGNKLGVTNRVELARIAISAGLVTLKSDGEVSANGRAKRDE